MTRVRVYKFKHRAEYWFEKWTREYEDKIQGMNRANTCVILRNGDELHFVCVSEFDNWRRGRKYKLELWEG